MITSEEFHQALNIVQQYIVQNDFDTKSIKKANQYLIHEETNFNIENSLGKYAGINPDSLLSEIDMSTRLSGILFYSNRNYGLFFQKRDWHTIKIKDLANISMSEFLQQRHAGIKMAGELKEICFWAGVTLNP